MQTMMWLDIVTESGEREQRKNESSAVGGSEQGDVWPSQRPYDISINL